MCSKNVSAGLVSYIYNLIYEKMALHIIIVLKVCIKLIWENFADQRNIKSEYKLIIIYGWP